jgi:hypothetical protein
MSLTLQALDEPPPLARPKTGLIGVAEARQAIELLKSKEWVSEAQSCQTRPAAAGRAKRLVTYMLEIEPTGNFSMKTWPEGKRWRWAVRRGARYPPPPKAGKK